MWRVWLAFEVRPGVSAWSLRDDTDLYRALRGACRRPNGKLDVQEYERWLDWFFDNAHLWAAS